MSCKKQIKRCKFHQCTNDSHKTEKKFFNFPRRSIKKWIEACGKKELYDLDPSYITRRHHVCEDHFSREDYSMILKPFKKRLRPGVVPRQSISNTRVPAESKSKLNVYIVSIRSAC